ncbi:chaperone modulator CbpM [Flavobacterium muglaense]|uniref:MerR family transcriptional regulator n=1 Tax=Flavobacterium muglaense TaxID=2764716 RepID=A0A923SK08_9FLAO|nr:chaperone modulator CbpM [Flavobacterium muglaense]MBC5838263.1 MerR family transcriptional regulator [Flavobacterium muglaense]MBC5844798.1 MerR family transcriptional regulator [Flavobacterium muglaense]
MIQENFIPITSLCIHYKIEHHFFVDLCDIGSVELHVFEKETYIDKESIYEIEKIIRIHQELDVNIEGVAIALNLLKKIESLQTEVNRLKNRLLLYEN